MIWLFGILCTFLFLLLLLYYRSFSSPPVILSLEFSVIYIFEAAYGYSLYKDEPLYGFFFLGVIFFCLGYGLFENVSSTNRLSQKNSRKFALRNKRVNIVLFICDIFAIYQAINMRRFVANEIEQAFALLHHEYELFNIFGYVRLIVLSIFVISFIVYLNYDLRKETLITCVHSFSLAIILSIMTTNRSPVLMPIISAIMIWLHKIKNISIDQMKKIAMVFILLICFFYWSSTIKFRDSGMQFLFTQLKVYFLSSFPAFIKWMEKPHEYLYGLHTFRFIYKLWGNEFISAQPFVLLENGEVTNVYTIFQYYSADFGPIYAFFVEFFLGGLYSILKNESKKRTGKRSGILLFGLYNTLFFSLVSQYGGDMYFSILSVWIQIVFWLWVFSRNIFLKGIK